MCRAPKKSSEVQRTMDEQAVARARELATSLAPLVGTIESERKMPPSAVDALVRAGVFKLCVRRAYGGMEADPRTMAGVIEAFAQVDGSAGWCAMIGATSGLMSSYLAPEIAQEIYGAPDATACGVFAPFGRATAVPGGYRVTGRWPFASGCEHAAWRMGGVFADGDVTEVRSVIFRADETSIVDTWNTSGLRGTGSHDLEVTDVFVPAARTFSMVRDRPRDGGYELPFFGVLASGVAAVGLGIARAALDEVIALVKEKKLPGGKKPIASRELVQIEIARAEARLGAARALLFAALGDAVAGGDAVLPRARLRLAACHAATEAAAVTSVAYDTGGGSAIYARHPLQRQFRDAHVVTHHIMVSSTALATAGRILLGVETETSML